MNEQYGEILQRIGTKRMIIAFILFLVFLHTVYFFFELRPVSRNPQLKMFEVKRGQGFFEIAAGLRDQRLIRSAGAFEFTAVLTGAFSRLKPGWYELSPASSTFQILALLSESRREVEVTIPQGASVRDVDSLLGKQNVLPTGTLIAFAASSPIEGRLYPDTYTFFEHSTLDDVVSKFLKNFEIKAGPILGQDPKNFDSNLILASLVQKEVSDPKEARLVAGILKKRLADGMSLGVDATICYLKREIKGESSCYPLRAADLKIESPYNTYLHSGLPPGPIGSPEYSAISAVLNPLPSPYWFYLSDPKTGKTIFSKTLNEHSINRALYLHS